MAARGPRTTLLLALLLAAAALISASPDKWEERRRDRRGVDLRDPAHGNAKDFRLPDGAWPLAYRLHLRVDPAAGVFSGHVAINVTCEAPTRSITLHVHELLQVVHHQVRITPVSRDFKGPSVSVTSTNKDVGRQWYVVSLSNDMVPTKVYQLEMSFSGAMVRDRSAGLFVDTYQVHRTHERRYFAATQMRPNMARSIFPCYDGPMYKASFDVSIERPRGLRALSNMPLRHTAVLSEDPSWEVDRFETTPRMCTASLAIIVCDLGVVTPKTTDVAEVEKDRKPEVSVIGRSHLLSQLEQAADRVPAILRWLGDYFAIDYPLPQLKLIALPHYSSSTPADMFGVIIFREQDLVNEESLTELLATELTFQWLGHISTPYPRAADVHVTRAFVSYLVNAMRQDREAGPQGRATLPPPGGYSLYYEYSKRHPYAQVGSMKEEIRAGKTEWMLRMLNYSLTETSFKNGVRKFFKNSLFHLFSEDNMFNVITEIAWREDTLLEPILVAYIVDSWFKPDRFPVITVTRNYDEHTATIEQHMFLREWPHEAANKDTQLWWIPIMVMTRDDMDISSLTTTTWMEQQKVISIADMPADDVFIIVNPEEIGMFMVNYDARNWQLLAEHLERAAAPGSRLPQPPPLTRAKLVHDAWNLMLAGELQPRHALDMMRFLAAGTERDPTVWDAFFNAADHLGRRFAGTDVDDLFKSFVRKVVTPLYESEPDSKLGRLAKHTLCAAGYMPCIEESLAAFGAWTRMEDPDEGNPVAESYMSFVFMWGPMDLWEFGLLRFLSFPENRRVSEKNFLLKELAGAPRAQDKMLRLLNVTFLQEGVVLTESEIRIILMHLGSSERGSLTMAQFLLDNWDAVKNRCAGNSALWEYFISEILSGFKTQAGLDMLNKMREEHADDYGPAEPLMDDAMHVVNDEAVWSANNLPLIGAWLHEYVGPLPTTTARTTTTTRATTTTTTSTTTSPSTATSASTTTSANSASSTTGATIAITATTDTSTTSA